MQHHLRGRRAVALALAGLVMSILGACGSGAESPAPAPAPAGSGGGSLTIAVPVDEPGLGVRTGDTYSGFEVDTATYVAAALGVPAANITWREARPTNREQLLTSGEVDLVFSTYSITEERKQQVDFAGPYFLAHQDLLVRRNDEEVIGPENLNGRRLCSVPGTTSAQLLRDRYRNRITLQEYPQYSDCVAALAKGDVDAVSTDDVILAGYAAQPQYKGRLRVVGDGFSDETYGVGVRKGDAAMVDKVNQALTAYIDDGSWERSLKRQVGPSGYAIPDPPKPGSV